MHGPEGEGHPMKNERTADRGVGIGDLRVVVQNGGRFWFAQGLDVNYIAQGDDLEDVKRTFVDGFQKTVEAHRRVYGNLENLLRRQGPSEKWRELAHVTIKRRQRTDVPAIFPFEGIEFLETEN
jgi:hypothetical protein